MGMYIGSLRTGACVVDSSASTRDSPAYGHAHEWLVQPLSVVDPSINLLCKSFVMKRKPRRMNSIDEVM